MDKQFKPTMKQIKFIDGVCSGMTQADAYRAAYNCGNMKPETIINKAYQLAHRDDIGAIIEQKQKELENTQLWVRKEALGLLTKITDADIKDFLKFKTAKTVVGEDPKTGEPIIDYRVMVDLLESNEVDGSIIQEVSVAANGTFKFKLYDKLRAIELANRMCGYNEPDKADGKTVEIKVTVLDEMARLAGYQKIGDRCTNEK